jgi:hypothetical protein
MFNWIRSREAETIQKIFNTSNADFRQIELKDLRDDRPCLVCTNLICLLRSCGVTDIQNAMKTSSPDKSTVVGVDGSEVATQALCSR